jgi:hypothetical protein
MKVKNIDNVSMLVGIVVGSGLSLVIVGFILSSNGAFSLLGTTVVRENISMGHDMDDMDTSEMKKSSSVGSHQTPQAHIVTGSNPYMMSPITSEKQFLKDMKLHHEAAVVMAQEVLKVKNIHVEVRTLANNIISAQTTEIKMMKDWITDWRY